MNDNRILIVDSLLQQVAEELDISPSKYQQAVDRYSAVGRWLEAGEYPQGSQMPVIFAQGSFRLGTIVRPIREGKESDYDIDLVCRITTPTVDARSLKHSVGNCLKSNGTYRKMLEPEGRRCWTLVYAEQDGIGFHLDVLPCKPNPLRAGRVDPRYGEQAVALTDMDRHAKSYTWGSSNPGGYADWFAGRQCISFGRVSHLQKSMIQRRNGEIYARVQDVPDQLVRTPLQRAIQVLKRHRDVRFAGHDNEADKPISMIITTLAALAYQQETSVYETLASFLDQIQRFQSTGIIRCANDKWVIANPVDPSENFADRWNDEDSKKADSFFQWVNWLQEDIDGILNSRSRPELERFLRTAFGDSPGSRVAGRYSGPIPGSYLKPISAFGRVADRLLRFDVTHRESPRWHIAPSPFTATISAKYTRDGFRPTAFRSNSPPLPKNVSLVFEAHTDVPKPYKVYWQVVNTGEEAQRAGQLRGDFYDSNKAGRTRTESTKYTGMHWVECFVVKNNVCVARSGEFVVNIQ